MRNSYLKYVALIIFAVLSLAAILNSYANYLEETKTKKAKADYEARLVLPKTDCENIPLDDKEYARIQAEQGDAEAAYEYAAYLATHDNKDTYYIPPASMEWLKIANHRGHLLAKNVLCSATTSYRQDREKLITEEQLNWCLDSAKHGSKSAYSALAYVYERGDGIKQDFEKAYFWMRLSYKSETKQKELASHLTESQIRSLEDQIEAWTPSEPIIQSMDAITQWKGIAHSSSKRKLNIEGLICGGGSGRCRISDRCGDLVGFVCPRNRPKYIIASISSKKIISQCPNGNRRCLDLVPEEWTCPSPQNMPLSKADQERFPNYKNTISCGDIFGTGGALGSDGPYYFISKKSGKTIGTCGFWQSFHTQSPCKPPEGWYCDLPSNYN